MSVSPITRRGVSSASRAFLGLTAIVAFLATAQPASTAQLGRTAAPDSLTDREFWDIFTSLSEESGTFPSENFVSNEQTFQHVIPTLQRSLKPGGVYLGVGPEQNFTYIANLKPRMAVIFDIRRQNAMAHLMYKALFELSPTRAEFVSRLFSRPLPSSLAFAAKADSLFAAANAASPSDSAFEANRRAIFDRLTAKHGFALSADDRSTITHVYSAFFDAGPNINYGYRAGNSMPFRPMYATYAQLQTLTNAAGLNMAFLATEENYQWLRALHQKNLVVPVVGDFAGPKAIRGVGDFLRKRGATVTAFYLSNVEQYLFRQMGNSERFYNNVKSLPLDSTAMFIRSVPPGDGGFGFVGAPMTVFGSSAVAGSNQYSVRVVDSGGVSIVWTTTTDSAGRSVTTRSIDSSGARRSPIDLFRSLRARDDSLMRARVDSVNRASSGVTVYRDSSTSTGMRTFVTAGGTLTSGIVSIPGSLDAFDKGNLRTYSQAIAMTKISGWQ